MASISPPTPQHKLYFTSSPKLPARRSSCPFQIPPFPSNSLLSRVSDSSALCRCSGSRSSNNSDNPSFQRLWDAATLQDAFKHTMERLDSYMKSLKKKANEARNGPVVEKNGVKDEKGEEEEWDWDRWKRHFAEVDEQQRLVSGLKSQLDQAVHSEDYEDAARLKVAIAAAATNDTVGRAMSNLNRAVAEERYQDAAFLRDNAATGLVGWWSGISEDVHDPYGLIVRITAEHGKYVARSYNPRQLTTAALGVPLFEIFLTMNKKGEYKQQAVYLKRKGLSGDPSAVFSKAMGASSRLNPSGPIEDKFDLFVVGSEDMEDGNDTEDGSDLVEGLPGFQNILRDMISGMKFKVLKVTAPEKVDSDFIFKLIEQIMDEEDEDKDIEVENAAAEDETIGKNDQETVEFETDVGRGVIDNEEPNEILVKVAGKLAEKPSSSWPVKDSLRVPAKLEKKGCRCFSFSVEKDVNRQDSDAKEPASVDGKAKLIGQMLKDTREIINLTLSRAIDHQQLSDSTTFHRIEISASPDPLNGLYIGAHGMYTSEVIHLKRKFGQWQDDHGNKGLSNVEFYEYVEAIKLTGDIYVPAGQVAFRAKVGKRYQLPHKGIIPEEFGVVARYKGQGRLAEPGFRNPRWVDGELVILDGKHIRGGPVVGFVYWAPEYHFLVFFNRLRLQQ